MTVHREHAMRSQFSFDLFLSFFVPRLLCSLGSVCFVAECQCTCIPVLVVTSLSDEVTEGSTEVTQSPTVLSELNNDFYMYTDPYCAISVQRSRIRILNYDFCLLVR